MGVLIAHIKLLDRLAFFMWLKMIGYALTNILNRVKQSLYVLWSGL